MKRNAIIVFLSLSVLSGCTFTYKSTYKLPDSSFLVYINEYPDSDEDMPDILDEGCKDKRMYGILTKTEREKPTIIEGKKYYRYQCITKPVTEN